MRIIFLVFSFVSLIAHAEDDVNQLNRLSGSLTHNGGQTVAPDGNSSYPSATGESDTAAGLAGPESSGISNGLHDNTHDPGGRAAGTINGGGGSDARGAQSQ